MSDVTDDSKPRLTFSALDLAPSWAQGPRTAVSGADSDRSRPGSNDRRRPSAGGRDRPPTRPRRDRPDGRPRSDADRDRDRDQPARSYHRPESGPEPVFLPITVQFIPARQGMETLARRLAESRRAYPLGRLTALFLAKPEAMVVRLASDPEALPEGQPPMPLYQCLVCRTVTLERDAVVQHILSAHLDRFYEQTEETTEAPSGHFVCVARCGYSGEWVGPPNYHGYHERLTALHRERFSHLSFDAYRSRMEMLRDPESIAAWQETMRKRAVYRTVTPAAPAGGETPAPSPSDSEPTVLTSRTEMLEHFMAHHSPETIRESSSCILSGPAARAVENASLQRLIHAAWLRESRSIMRTAITVRGMLRAKGFTTFKTSDQRDFMTAVTPVALQATETVEIIRQMLDYVEAHPGCARTALWEHLGLPANPVETANEPAQRHFQWLVEKGRLIFFQDGTLAVPGQVHSIRPPTRPADRRRRRKAQPVES